MKTITNHAATLCAHLGRGENPKSGFINPATDHGSTYLFPDLESLSKSNAASFDPTRVAYGRHGIGITRELEQLVAKLEGGYAARATSSGLTAITTALLSFVESGDHILVVDSVFDPTRRFCDTVLKRANVEVSYYAPGETEQLETRIQDNTKLIFMESPGSLTLEVQDVPAIIEIAKQHQLLTMIDNTWASPVLFPAIQFGVNISIQSASKYIGGHADLILGLIISDEANWQQLVSGYSELGQYSGSSEVTLALRGMRSLPLRIKQHGESGLALAKWLQTHHAIDAVFHPAIPGCAGHSLWERDFSGASGLFSVLLKPCSKQQLSMLITSLDLFGMGVSWGGYESLVLPVDPSSCRTIEPWTHAGTLLRISVGLEDVDDLIADFDQALIQMAQTPN